VSEAAPIEQERLLRTLQYLLPAHIRDDVLTSRLRGFARLYVSLGLTPLFVGASVVKAHFIKGMQPDLICSAALVIGMAWDLLGLLQYRAWFHRVLPGSPLANELTRDPRAGSLLQRLPRLLAWPYRGRLRSPDRVARFLIANLDWLVAPPRKPLRLRWMLIFSGAVTAILGWLLPFIADYASFELLITGLAACFVGGSSEWLRRQINCEELYHYVKDYME
jgi:hypothetical protein